MTSVPYLFMHNAGVLFLVREMHLTLEEWRDIPSLSKQRVKHESKFQTYGRTI